MLIALLRSSVTRCFGSDELPERVAGSALPLSGPTSSQLLGRVSPPRLAQDWLVEQAGVEPLVPETDTIHDHPDRPPARLIEEAMRPKAAKRHAKSQPITLARRATVLGRFCGDLGR